MEPKFVVLPAVNDSNKEYDLAIYKIESITNTGHNECSIQMDSGEKFLIPLAKEDVRAKIRKIAVAPVQLPDSSIVPPAKVEV